MPHSLETAQPDFEGRFAAFLAAKRETEEAVDQTVAAILAEVRERGDALLPEELRIAEQEIGTAKAACAEAELAALAEAAERITDYHRHQVPEDLDYPPGCAWVTVGRRSPAPASMSPAARRPIPPRC
jgi:histidinol dehydrogenase